MKAIIFAAGMGTRLKPITNNIPKALVPLNGKPLIDHAIEKLIDAGIHEIVINIHHFGDLIINHIKKSSHPVSIQFSDERDQLLETGGAVRKAAPLLKDNAPVIALNVDIISSINLNELINQHIETNALATLAVRKRETSRYLLFNSKMELAGWKNINTNEVKMAREPQNNLIQFAFSGIQVLSPQFFDLITETGKFSIIETYLRLASTQKIMGFHDKSSFWIDVGKPGEIEKAEKFSSNK
ncbi:MAG TPA: nucleotidyltransferase family protein [Prolixibacteraceae bacterium]|nr:nucleotidyltransferase family protein [Prolixibacteraceae bacterium]